MSDNEQVADIISKFLEDKIRPCVLEEDYGFRDKLFYSCAKEIIAQRLFAPDTGITLKDYVMEFDKQYYHLPTQEPSEEVAEHE